VQYDDKLLEAISRLRPEKWEGEVFRHMFANYSPENENTSGARWNVPEVPAIYTCLSREVVLAEAEYQIRMQPHRPRARRTVYKIGVRLNSVIDISDVNIMRLLSLTADALADEDLQHCQKVGSSVERLGHDGLLVPSARAKGTNLVIFPNRTVEGAYRFEVIDAEVVDPGMRW